jgi:hypothetical protein
MATTQWDTVSTNPLVGQVREQELRTSFWAETLGHGACYMRIQTPQRDIGEIIEYILTKQFEAVVIQIQEELVQLDKRVAETEAGETLIDTLQKQLMGPNYKLDPQAKDLTKKNEEQLKEFPVDAGFEDGVSGRSHLRSEGDSSQYVPPSFLRRFTS